MLYQKENLRVNSDKFKQRNVKSEKKNICTESTYAVD